MRPFQSIATSLVAAADADALACRRGGRRDDGFAKRLFAENFAPDGKSYACFVRRYDAAHLASIACKQSAPCGF